MSYISLEETRKAFGEFLKKYRGYSQSDVDMALMDFEDFYDNEFCGQEWLESDFKIDGEKYEKRSAWVAFQEFGGGKPFRFYMYFHFDDDDDGHTVGEYQECKRLFQVDDINDEDFPDWVNKQDKKFEEQVKAWQKKREEEKKEEEAKKAAAPKEDGPTEEDIQYASTILDFLEYFSIVIPNYNDENGYMHPRFKMGSPMGSLVNKLNVKYSEKDFRKYFFFGCLKGLTYSDDSELLNYEKAKECEEYVMEKYFKKQSWFDEYYLEDFITKHKKVLFALYKKYNITNDELKEAIAIYAGYLIVAFKILI